MGDNDVRQTLDELIRSSGEDYASVSRMLGRNPTYIQQFVKRGVPRRLHEDDRRALSLHFGVAEALLGGPGREATSARVSPQASAELQGGDYLIVPALSVSASAGPGHRVHRDFEAAALAVKVGWAKQLASGNVEALTTLAVEGDSMQPTLGNGDQILVDTSDRADRLRDGIYVLRVDGALLVKRIAIHPSSRRLSILSDNPAYPSWQDCELDAVVVIGRVVWASRCVG